MNRKDKNHTDTPSGLSAAFRRGKKLAHDGAGEAVLNQVAERCRSRDMEQMLRNGYSAGLQAIYKLEAK